MADEKILKDELLSDEELEQVAGGKAEETAADSRFLNSLNGSCRRYTKYSINSINKPSIKNAWAQVGIQADLSPSGSHSPNRYYLNGHRITQEQARQHAMDFVGKQMKESDWNW